MKYPPNNESRNYIAIISTFLFNNAQLGGVYYVIASGMPLINAFYFSLAFELAILTDCFFKFGSERMWAGVCLVFSAIATVILLTGSHAGSDLQGIALLISVFAISFSLKKIRSLSDAYGKVKTYWRAAGYITCFIFSPVVIIFGLIPIFILATLRKKPLSERVEVIPIRFDDKDRFAYLSIALHHIHYFAYAYLIPISFFKESNLSLLLFGVVFYVGWIGYYKFERLDNRIFLWVSAGHAISSSAIFLMTFFDSGFSLLFLWAVTAIGAGTIVALRSIYTTEDASTYDSFKSWEAIGHVIGISAMGIALSTHNFNFAYFTGAVAGILCSITVIGCAARRKII